MRKPLLILLAAELLVAVVLGQTAHVHSPARDRAWGAWHQNPTPEARLELERQQRRTEIGRWVFTGVVFLVLGGTTGLVFRIRRGEPAASSEDGRNAQPVSASGARRT